MDCFPVGQAHKTAIHVCRKLAKMLGLYPNPSVQQAMVVASLPSFPCPTCHSPLCPTCNARCLTNYVSSTMASSVQRTMAPCPTCHARCLTNSVPPTMVPSVRRTMAPCPICHSPLCLSQKNKNKNKTKTPFCPTSYDPLRPTGHSPSCPTNYSHSDMSRRPCPPLLSVLHTS